MLARGGERDVVAPGAHIARAAGRGVGTGPRQLINAAAIVALVVATNAVLVAPLPPELRLVGAFFLLVALPGHLLVQAVFNGTRPGALDRHLLALGAGCVLASLLTLVLYVLTRPLPTGHLLLGSDLLNAGLLLGALARRAELRPYPRRPGRPLLAVLALAAPLRLVDLGHSEFQADEGWVALRSFAVLQGAPDALIAHPKPPGEVLLNAAFTGLLGVTTELDARLPFALVGVAGVLGFYRLGRALFGPRAGLMAGLLLAANGYFVAFARVLQYESVALLLDSMAVLCLFRFARRPAERRGYAVAGALMLAGSALMAFSAAFLLPVAALALWRPAFGPNRAPRRELLTWLWPLALVLPALLLAYVLLARGTPSALDLSSAWGYLGRRLGERHAYFNLWRLLRSVNHYNSVLYLSVIGGAGAVVVLHALYDRCAEIARASGARARPGPASAGMALVGGATGLLPIPATVGLLLGSARRSLGWKMALVWLSGPLFTHLYLVRQPITHWREVFPGLILLVAASAARLYERAGPRERWAALALGLAFLASIEQYVYVAFVQPWPEYQRVFPQVRHPLDWTDPGISRRASIYGHAHLDGWKVAGELVASGQLPAAYDSNETSFQAAWYMRGPRACEEEPELYVHVGRGATDRRMIDLGQPREGYFLAGQVYVAGRPKLSLLVRRPVAGGPRVYHAEEYGRWFDRELALPWTGRTDLHRTQVVTEHCSRDE